MNNYKLTDLQQACLLLIRTGRDDELHKNWNNQVDSLMKLYLIQYKPNTKDELMLTVKGQECLANSIVIKYPLHVKGNMGSYNNVIKTMSDSALDALICAMINDKVFNNINKKTARVLGQHLLDINFYKKWGSVLINKWLKQCNSSMLFFSNMDDKKTWRKMKEKK